jgi:hypothetical protein
MSKSPRISLALPAEKVEALKQIAREASAAERRYISAQDLLRELIDWRIGWNSHEQEDSWSFMDIWGADEDHR